MRDESKISTRNLLSPWDIHNKKFRIKWRGYDTDEVNDYLDLIIKDYQAMLSDIHDLTLLLEEKENSTDNQYMLTKIRKMEERLLVLEKEKLNHSK